MPSIENARIILFYMLIIERILSLIKTKTLNIRHF